jgi:hypothetical protein
LADEGAGIQILNISDPRNPERTCRFFTGGTAARVSVSNGFAYVTDWDSGVDIVDVSSPESPQKVGTMQGKFGKLVISGSYAYALLHPSEEGGEFQFVSMDISDPLNAHRVGAYGPIYYLSDVVVSGTYAYCAGAEGVKVLDVSDPQNLKFVADFPVPSAHEFSGFQIDGNYAVWGGFWQSRAGTVLHVIDITNPVEPTLLSESRFDEGRVGGVWATLSGDVLALGPDLSVALMDISDPASPQRRWVQGTLGEETGRGVSGNYVYAPAGRYGLRIYRLTTLPPPPITSGSTARIRRLPTTLGIRRLT